MEQWIRKKHNKNPPPHHLPILVTKLQIDAEKQKECLKKLNDIMETTYADIKNTPTYKILQKNLEEASKRYLYCHQQPITDKNIQSTNQSIDSILNQLDTIQSSHILKSVNKIS